MASVWLAVYIFYAIFLLGRIWKTGKKYKVKLVYQGIIFWDSGYQCSNMPPGMGYFFVNCRGIPSGAVLVTWDLQQMEF